MYLSIVIPAYNEETRLGKTLKTVSQYLREQSYEYEILAVNDGSRDGTAALIQNLSEKIPHLKLIDNKENHGKGYVVRQGMLQAKGAIRLFMDADNSTSIDHFGKMTPLFENGYGVVIGTRDRRDNPEARQSISQPWYRRVAGDIGNLIVQLLVIPGIWDTQCGFKAFSARAAQDIFSRAIIDRWAFDVEALGLAKKLGHEIGLIPVQWVNDPKSHVKIMSFINSLVEVFKIWWRLRKQI